MENLHPMMVHFPIALLTASWLLEAPAVLFRKPAWQVVSLWNLIFGWIGALAAVLAGRVAMADAKHSMEIYQVMERHERIGYAVLALAAVPLIGRLLSRDRLSVRQRGAAWVLLGAACAAMAYGAHLGGRLVYEFGVGGSYGRTSGIEVVR